METDIAYAERSHVKADRPAHFRDFSQSTLPRPYVRDRFCPRPFEHVEIMHGHGPDQSEGFGDVYLCCAGWLSRPVGNYLTQEMTSIWNSSAAREIRASILDGSFRYCNAQACPFIQGNRLEERDAVQGPLRRVIDEAKTWLESPPLSYLLCYDRSCNLTCPSCRSGRILFTSGPGVELPRRLNAKILKDLFGQPHNRPVRLQVTGSGDPFASLPFRELLGAIEGRSFPGLKVDLFTNGIMLTGKTWSRLGNLAGHVSIVSVSVDAATARTYASVRGGDWDQLVENLTFIGELRRRGEIDAFYTNFVVQAANFGEIGDFVRLSRSKGVDTIHFSLVADWQSWTPDRFNEQAVWRPDHSAHQAFLEALCDPDLSDPIAFLGALAPYRDQALERKGLAAGSLASLPFGDSAERLPG